MFCGSLVATPGSLRRQRMASMVELAASGSCSTGRKGHQGHQEK
jgi:hypothetical protein